MPQRFLRISEVRNRVPFSRSQIYLLISRGEFPKPVSLGARAVAWLDSEVDNWMIRKIDAQRGGEVSESRK